MAADDINDLLQKLSANDESYWINKGSNRVLELFHSMATRVPAYKDFLKKNNIDHEKIISIKDFKQIPSIDKNNYLRAYPLPDLCWDGEFKTKQWVVSATSGSTGEPFYFPRRQEQDLLYAKTAELYLRTNFDIQNKSTLYIIAFPMGIWIGGVFTYQALQHISSRSNYPLTIVTPGINKLEILKTVKNLGHHFDQIIIGSYAPFLKDIIDDGIRMGIEWSKYKMGFIFSAEAFSEHFRDYVMNATGITDVYKRTLNHYGTVDLGTMSHETPVSILLRRLAMKNNALFQSIFGQITKTPTLTQYNPEDFFFEDVDGNLFCSSYSGLPLVRYDLKDHGGIISFDQMLSVTKSHNIDIFDEIGNCQLTDTMWKLPFVFVYERSDFSVSFFAFQIYPETIRKALQRSEFEHVLTGKFTMLVKYNESGSQILEINVEMKFGNEKTEELMVLVQRLIKEQLLQESSEYRKTYEEYGDTILPQIVFWPYEDETFFRPGIKQKWVKK